MGTATRLMTVEEFSRLPEEHGPEYFELRRGEVVTVTQPKFKHSRIQGTLGRLLGEATGPNYVAAIEFPFRPVSEYELRVADVALMKESRYNETDPEGYFRGSPELVVEVLSPSNTASDLYEREKLVLENGGHEFWVIDPDRKQIIVSTPDLRSITYKIGQQIPLASFGGTMISVDDIFRS